MAIIDIEPQKCLELIEKNKDNPEFVILDVRGPNEHSKGHVKDSVLLEFGSSDFRQKLEKLDKEKTYLVYCHSGMRSTKASEIMEKLGFKNIYTMKKGFSNWSACGLPQE